MDNAREGGQRVGRLVFAYRAKGTSHTKQLILFAGSTCSLKGVGILEGGPAYDIRIALSSLGIFYQPSGW